VSSSNPSVFDIEPADADDARAVWPMLAQIIKNRRPALWVMRGRDEAARLMEQKEPRPGAVDEGLAVDGDFVVGPDVDGRVRKRHAVQGDASFADPAFRLTAGAEPRPCHDLGDACARCPPASARASSVGFGFRSPPLPGAGLWLKGTRGLATRASGNSFLAACGLAAFWGDPAAPLRQLETGPLHGGENALCLDVRA